MFLIWHILLICWELITLVGCLRLNIITVIVGNNAAYGYPGVAPIYDVAFDNMKAKYPHLFVEALRFTVYANATYTCVDGGAMMPALAGSQIWDLQNNKRDADLIVMFCSGCSAEIIALGDYVREWNIPLFASLAGDSVLANKIRYPTVTTFAVMDHNTLPAATKILMDKFNWRLVTLLCDSGQSLYPVTISWFWISCANVKRRLELSTGVYAVTTITFDTKFAPDYRSMLLRAQTLSRVIMIFANPRSLRDIMIMARVLNMTNGDYVYLSSLSVTVPFSGNLTWQYDKEDDLEAFEAFRSLIILRNPDPKWDRITNILEASNRTSIQHLNRPYITEELYNDCAIDAYEAFEAFAEVLNESCTATVCPTGKAFARLFWNRTFEFPARPFFINSVGMRYNDVELLRLNTTNGKMEEAWHFSAAEGTFIAVSNLSSTWKGPDGPPSDRPLCGFRGELCDEKSSLTISVAIPASACVVIAVFLALAALFKCMRTRLTKDQNVLWWWLDEAMFREASAEIALFNASKRHFTIRPKNDFLTANLRMYKNDVVWADTFSPGFNVTPLQKHKIVQSTLQAMKHLRHENVGTFLGMVTVKKKTSFLFEFGSRGSLRMILNNRNFNIDQSMQNTITWEILEGVNYIQSSCLQIHGSLTSLSTMINKRFCTQLCDYGTSRILSALLDRTICSKTSPILLWRAPETFVNDKTLLTKEADIYSTGVVLAEIFTFQTPLNVDFHEENSLNECLRNLRMNSEPRIFVSRAQMMMMPVISECVGCMTLDPFSRPTIKRLMDKLQGQLPRYSIADSLIYRLHHYAEDLERVVRSRTLDLLEEARKVDALLRQMIPAEFVVKLRNKETVPAESFDSVTVLFSDFPDFSEICLRMTPLYVTMLLNHVYCTFDTILPKLDVYKVETINDSYMVASGLPNRNGIKHAAEIASLALAMQEAALKMHLAAKLKVACNMDELPLRIGFNSGQCAAGIIGTRTLRYCLFGDTVNTASRMESQGEVYKIHLSMSSHILLKVIGGFICESRGKIIIKGKGETETFWLLGRTPGPREAIE